MESRPTWRQGLLQLLGLLLVRDDQGVQVPAAAHLELHIVLVLLDLYGCRTTRTRLRSLGAFHGLFVSRRREVLSRLTLGILPPGCQQEIFDFVDLARLQ